MLILLIHLALTAGTTYLVVDNFNLYSETIISYLSVAGISVLFYFIILIFFIIFFNILGKLHKNSNVTSKVSHIIVDKMIAYACIIFRIKIITTNKNNIPKNENFVIISNHQAQIDIVGILKIFGKHKIAFISKKSVFNVPLVGTWMKKIGCVGIDNSSDREAAKSIILGIKNIKKGLNMCIFPEGMRSKGPEMNEFKAGALKLAMKPKSTILPLTINNAYIAEKKVFKIFKRATVKLHIHEPIKYDDYKELNSNQLSFKLQELINSKIER